MRIGILTGEYPPLQGGVGAFSHILAQHLSEQGQEVFIFSESRAKQQLDDLLLTTHQGRWNFESVRAVQRWMNEQELDLVNMQFQTAAYSMSPWVHFLPHFLKIPLITTFHDLRFPYLFPKAGPLRDWIVMHLARASSGVIVTNYEDHARLTDLPIAEVIPIGSNIHPVPISDEECGNWRKNARASHDDFLLAHFGFINHSKGIDTLLVALAALRKKEIPAKLVMIGGRTGTADPTNAHYLEHIDTQIVQMGLKDHVHWTGYVDDAAVSGYLQVADVVTLPYRDGASFRRGSLMAAIQHDCPIVTTSPSYPNPLFSDGSLYLVAADSHHMLTEALIDLYHNPERMTTLREKVKALKHHFDWQHIAQLTVNHYRHVLGGSA